jgi:hypothetical protein
MRLAIIYNLRFTGDIMGKSRAFIPKSLYSGTLYNVTPDGSTETIFEYDASAAKLKRIILDILGEDLEISLDGFNMSKNETLVYYEKKQIETCLSIVPRFKADIEKLINMTKESDIRSERRLLVSKTLNVVAKSVYGVLDDVLSETSNAPSVEDIVFQSTVFMETWNQYPINFKTD